MGLRLKAAVVFFLVSILAGMPGLALTVKASTVVGSSIPGERQENGDLYIARTLDGVDLALKRYRPDENASHNLDGQPLILMPGILCNHNFYDVRRPEGKDYRPELPASLAPWAQGDPRIQADPMLYYSLAYFLWKQGYDVWLADYRGQGRDPVISGGAGGYAIDELAALDMPAIVTRVREVTGKKPVWVGHSMGSTMAYMYLQGARFSDPANPDSPVVSDPALVRERNDGEGAQAIRGLVDLDGPVIPGGSVAFFLQPLVGLALSAPFYVDLKWLADSCGCLLTSPVMMLQALLYGMSGLLGLIPGLDIFNIVLFINTGNIDWTVSRFFFTQVLDGVSTRTLAQFEDAIWTRKLREDLRNRPINIFGLMFPPMPTPGDGYYYYSDNLGKISLPALVVADATRDITNPDDVRSFYDRKARHAKDAFRLIPGTAHVDLVMGKNAPAELYPLVGSWIEGLLGGS